MSFAHARRPVFHYRLFPLVPGDLSLFLRSSSSFRAAIYFRLLFRRVGVLLSPVYLFIVCVRAHTLVRVWMRSRKHAHCSSNGAAVPFPWLVRSGEALIGRYVQTFDKFVQSYSLPLLHSLSQLIEAWWWLVHRSNVPDWMISKRLEKNNNG